MNEAKTFAVVEAKGLKLSPFQPATELPPNTFEGGDLMRLPLYCGKHHGFYPAALAGGDAAYREALRSPRWLRVPTRLHDPHQIRTAHI